MLGVRNVDRWHGHVDGHNTEWADGTAFVTFFARGIRLLILGRPMQVIRLATVLFDLTSEEAHHEVRPRHDLHQAREKMIAWVEEGHRTRAQAVTYVARFCSCGRVQYRGRQAHLRGRAVNKIK